MRTIVVFLLLVFTSHSNAQEWYIPAHYSLRLKEDHPLYSYAIDGACGPYISLRSNKLPVDQKNLRFNDIFELSKESALVKVWRAPMDSRPVAVDQNALTIHIFEPGNNYVYISPGSQIARAFDQDETKFTAERFPCPEVEGMPQIKEHMICAALTDRTTKEKRIFAWSPPCT